MLEIEGTGALQFLQGQTSNDVLALEVGVGCSLVFADPKGRVLSVATCFRTVEGAILEMERDRAAFLTGHLAKYLMLADATLTDTSEQWQAALVTNPTVDRYRASRDGDGWQLGVPLLGRLPAALTLRRSGAPGPSTQVPSLQVPSIQVGSQAAEAVRIEEGMPVYGRDVDDRNLPQDALLAHALSFSKGCFTGQEPIARLHYRGKPSRELRGLVFDTGDPGPQVDATVVFEGNPVGRVTSTTYSPGLERHIAMAYIKRKAWSAVRVEVVGLQAELRELPLYPDS